MDDRSEWQSGLEEQQCGQAERAGEQHPGQVSGIRVHCVVIAVWVGVRQSGCGEQQLGQAEGAGNSILGK